MVEKGSSKTIAVLGAYGYIGNRLVQRLLAEGHQVVAAASNIDKLKNLSWASHPSVKLAQFDALNYSSVKNVLTECTHAYYLIHSLKRTRGHFADLDRRAARNIATAGNRIKLKQLIYLGALGEHSEKCSEHLLSRFEVGEILRRAQFPITILRAAMVIGSGNASFEMIRYMTERCPIILAPKYCDTNSQPIAITNLLEYLLFCLDNENVAGQTFDLGGPDIISYRHMVEVYAQQAKLPRRRIIYVPLENIYLTSTWLSLITPIPRSFIKHLIPSLRTDMICKDYNIKRLYQEKLLTIEEAMSRACDKEQKLPIDWRGEHTRRLDEWADRNEPAWSGGKTFIDCKKKVVKGNCANVWQALKQIGGSKGWYGTDWVWKLQEHIDSLFSGLQQSQGRSNPEGLQVGDEIGPWRVYAVRDNQLLVLRFEVNSPGETWLEFRLRDLPNNRCEIKQSVFFCPRGLTGEIYWHAVKPVHDYIFSQMLKGLVKASDCAVSVWTPWTALQDLFASAKAEQETVQAR